ncbi:MAG: hypothetical protein ABIN69_18535 [Aestuariivirga sp.]
MTYLKYVWDSLQKGNLGDVSFLDYAIGKEVTNIRARISADNFWFVAIPRTSSSYIQTNLGAQFGFPHGKQGALTQNHFAPKVQSILLPEHTPVFIVREILGPELLQRCNSFSVVRNPYAWILSLWRYTKLYGSLGFSDSDFLTFLAEFKRNVTPPRLQRNWYPSNYCQHDYLTERSSDKFLVKNILKFEDRGKIDEFLLGIGLKSIPLRAGLMASDSSDYKLDENEKAAIRKVLEKDFDLLKY